MTEDAAKNRDLYLQYMRIENPDYDLFTREEALAAAVKPEEHEECDDEFTKHPYSCWTQEHDGVAEIYLGMDRGALHLWESGCVINWTARRDGWPNKNTAEQAIRATWNACETWNKVMEGRVTFKYVSNLSDAAFELRFDKWGRDGLLASAFFPNEYRRDLNFLRVYRSSFDSRYTHLYRLYNTMLHELGHILGLRHEFAHEKEKWAESILFGVKNEKSVMAYYPSQEIQETDVVFIRKAYDELKHGETVHAQGPVGQVSKLIFRVLPNN